MLESRFEGAFPGQNVRQLFVITKAYTVDGTYDALANIDPTLWDRYDITGWELEFVIRDAPSDAEPALTLTVGAGITITNGAEGELLVEWDDDDTAEWPGALRFAMLRRIGSGTKVPLWRGEIPMPYAEAR